MNVEQQRLISRDYEHKLTAKKHHNKNGRHTIRDHITELSEVFETLAAAGAPPNEEEDVLYLKESIMKKKLETGKVYHIFVRQDMHTSFKL